MPWIVHVLSSAVRCMRKSNDCDLQNADDPGRVVTDRENDKKVYSNLILTCNCCQTKPKKKKTRSRTEDKQSSKTRRDLTGKMSDTDNNNCPDLKSKENKLLDAKTCGCGGSPMASAQRSFKIQRRENRINSSGSLPAGIFDRPDSKDFSKFHRTPNNPHRTTLCRHSSARLPSVYSSPRVVKWPSHRSFREVGTRPRFESTSINPPPNRTIVKTEGRVIVSVTRNEQTVNDQSGVTLEKTPTGNGPGSENGRENALSGNWTKNPSPQDPTLNSCPNSEVQSTRSFHESDPPPEYSDPPDYFAVA